MVGNFFRKRTYNLAARKFRNAWPFEAGREFALPSAGFPKSQNSQGQSITTPSEGHSKKGENGFPAPSASEFNRPPPSKQGWTGTIGGGVRPLLKQRGVGSRTPPPRPIHTTGVNPILARSADFFRVHVFVPKKSSFSYVLTKFIKKFGFIVIRKMISMEAFIKQVHENQYHMILYRMDE